MYYYHNRDTSDAMWQLTLSSTIDLSSIVLVLASAKKERSMPKDRRRVTVIQQNDSESSTVTVLNPSWVSPPLPKESTSVDMDVSPDRNAHHSEKRRMKMEGLQLKRILAKPYSKSYNRRVKKKERDQTALGLQELKSIIKAVENPDSNEQTYDHEAQPSDSGGNGDVRRLKTSSIQGQIGEGKGLPLKEGQRRRALKIEQMRSPMIRSNPNFALNPFQTIKTHAQNSLLRR